MSKPWQGALPSSWSLRPFKAEFRRGKRLGDGTGEMLSVYREYGVVPKASRSDNFNKASEDLSKYQQVTAGDLVVNKMKAWQGSLGVSAHDGIVSPAYFVYKAIGSLDRRFAHYLLRSRGYADHMAAISSGIRPNQWDLDPMQLAVTPLVVPPPAEQNAIADFLDRETAQIDAFIAKNEQLIALLAERRAAVIAHGLRNSGGEVQSEKLGHSCRLGNGSTPRREDPRYWANGDFPWLNSSFVNRERVESADQFVTNVALQECHLPRVRPGAVVVGLTGEGRTRGMATIVEIDVTVNQHLAYIQPDERKWYPDYLLWLMRSRYKELRDLSDANGSTKGGLTVSLLRSMRVERPSLENQRRTAEELTVEVENIAKTVEHGKLAIELARERRAALISATVTGKIDVGVDA